MIIINPSALYGTAKVASLNHLHCALLSGYRRYKYIIVFTFYMMPIRKIVPAL